MFDPTYGANAAGLNYIRVPIGASDFSASSESVCSLDIYMYPHFILEYSLDDTSGDTSFAQFNINAVPSYVFTVLNDIIAINKNVKVHLVPWSPVCHLQFLV